MSSAFLALQPGKPAVLKCVLSGCLKRYIPVQIMRQFSSAEDDAQMAIFSTNKKARLERLELPTRCLEGSWFVFLIDLG